VAQKAIEVLESENLTENAADLGDVFRSYLQKKLVDSSELVQSIRGKGLLNAIVINDHEEGDTAWKICLKLASLGLLAKPTHGNIIRFAPPLVINRKQLETCCDLIIEGISEFDK
jgi:ornithine--oxo-acid transaminase